jgi:hypothetical protein
MSNYCETKSIPVDAIAVAALRKADTVSFHRGTAGSFILATKKCESTASDPFAPREREIRIEVDFTFVNGHGADAIPAGSEFTAFEWVSDAGFDFEWITIANLIKAGDVLCLDWHRGAMNSPFLTSHGLVGDSLSLSITRGDGESKPKRTQTFLINKSVSADNSARMIKSRVVTYQLT